MRSAKPICAPYIAEKFPQRCLWSSSIGRLIEDIPDLSSLYQGRSSSTSFLYTSLKVIEGVFGSSIFNVRLIDDGPFSSLERRALPRSTPLSTSRWCEGLGPAAEIWSKGNNNYLFWKLFDKDFSPLGRSACSSRTLNHSKLILFSLFIQCLTD